MLRESDSLPEEGIATTADIVAAEAEKTPSEGRLCLVGEKPGAAEEKTGVAM
jgi:uracil-DNA glycosylase